MMKTFFQNYIVVKKHMQTGEEAFKYTTVVLEEMA